MVWIIGIDEGVEFAVDHKILDGDPLKVEYVDPTPDLGYSEGFFDRGQLNYGRALKPDHMPTKMIRLSKKEPVPDIFMAYGFYIVCQEFKECVERAEPSVHQFFPIDIVWKDKTVMRKMYIFNICSRICGVDPALSTARFYSKNLKSYELDTGNIVFNYRLIGNHHAWKDRQVYGGLFLSNKLHQDLKHAGIKNLACTQWEHVEA